MMALEAACSSLIEALKAQKVSSSRRFSVSDSFLDSLTDAQSLAERSLSGCDSIVLELVVRLVALLERSKHDSEAQGWTRCLNSTWRLHTVVTDSLQAARHTPELLEQLNTTVLSQRLFSRIATLVTAAAAHNKQTVIAACIIAELAMGYYRALLKQRRNTAARAFLVEALGTEAVHDCFGMLVRASARVSGPPHQRIKDLAGVSKFLDEVQSYDPPTANTHLSWILAAQTHVLIVQLQVVEEDCNNHGEAGLVRCLGRDLKGWALPQVLRTAKAVMRTMTDRHSAPNPRALDPVWPALPEVISLCHTILHMRDAAHAPPEDPRVPVPESAATAHTPKDHHVLGMVNDAAQLIMQCLACAAPSPSRDQALPLSPTGVGCFILLLARGARLAHGAHEQLQALLNISGALNLLAHLWRPDDFGREEIAELTLAARQMLASLTRHVHERNKIAASAGVSDALKDALTALTGSGDAARRGGCDGVGGAVAGGRLTRPLNIAAAPAGSGDSQGAATAQVSTPPLAKIDSRHVYSTALHLLGAVHNLSLAPQRHLKTTHDSCLEPSSLAGVLQWQLLPLVTALLEETLTYEAAELANAKTLPAQDAMRDLYSAMSIVELQALVGTEICDASGKAAWKLLYGGSPAGLHLLATLLKHSRALSLLAATTNAPTGNMYPPQHIVQATRVIVALAASVVRSLDVRGPLNVWRQASTERSSNGSAQSTRSSTTHNADHPTAHLGPGWQCAAWGFAALAVWREAAALAATAAPDSAWQTMAEAAMQGAAPNAIQLLLHAAEEIIVDEEAKQAAPPLRSAPSAEGSGGSTPRGSSGKSSLGALTSPGGLTKLLQQQSHAPHPIVRARQLHRLDTARERLCSLYTACETKHSSTGSGLSAPASAGAAQDQAPGIAACKDRCIALARALLPLLPGSSGQLPDFIPSTTSVCSVVAQPEPWAKPWHTHPLAWMQVEAAQLCLPRDHRGCSNPHCASPSGCSEGQFLAMQPCAACGLARYCCEECRRQACGAAGPHAHSCHLLAATYGRALRGSNGAVTARGGE